MTAVTPAFLAVTLLVSAAMGCEMKPDYDRCCHPLDDDKKVNCEPFYAGRFADQHFVYPKSDAELAREASQNCKLVPRK